MGICLPRGDIGRLCLRRWREQTERIRVVQRQREQNYASRRAEKTERVGFVRHARQRRGVVQRRVRSGLLQEQPESQSARAVERHEVRAARRRVGIERGCAAERQACGRRTGIYGHVLQGGCDWVSVRAAREINLTRRREDAENLYALPTSNSPVSRLQSPVSFKNDTAV